MAKYKLEELTIDEAKKALAVASFTNSVKANEIPNSIWEKNKDFENQYRERRIGQKSTGLGYSKQLDRTSFVGFKHKGL